MTESFISVVAQHNQKLWESLHSVSIEESVQSFLNNLSPHTKRAYRAAFNAIFKNLCENQLLSSHVPLATLALSNLENLLDCIKERMQGSEATRQSRAAAFISYTKYLQRTTKGIIKSVEPLRSSHNSTFKRIRKKAHTETISLEEWQRFICELKNYCFRDYLIAKAVFQGAKRISEVLQAKIENIDWENKRIKYAQSKSLIIEDFTIITYPDSFFTELKEYLRDKRSGFIFCSSRGNPLTQPHLYRTFSRVSEIVNLSKRVHPHMLRTSAITLLIKMGFHSDQIMKISGHANPTAVLYYDKSKEEDNISTKVALC